MKKILILAIFSALAITTSRVFAQTTVTGHVFAEVVESVSASTCSQATITIQRNQTEGVNLGTIDIKSTESAMCSLILSKASLTDNNQNQCTMETSAIISQNMEENSINGPHSISLQCQPDKNMLAQSASSYTGNIDIVLAYN